jgi:asparagine synthase (glutamine-hydrolysing)
MCGLAGILRFDDRPVEEKLLQDFQVALRHRGPDARGSWSEGAVGLAHTRLAIIDVEGGVQPMRLEEPGLTVAFNGEIFNHVELRAELEALGHRFGTRSDTEVLLHAFAEWDLDCVERFNGQWAFAIHDARTRRLVLSRDRLGIRPLYVHRNARRLLFASELPALFADAETPRRFDAHGLRSVFSQWFPLAPHTAFAEIEELRPGHTRVIQQEREEDHAYWQLSFDAVLESGREQLGQPERSAADWAEELQALLDDATSLRLRRSDVPVGAYLSGGLDSSATVALARRHAEQTLTTFSVTFADPEYDEERWQRLLVERFGVQHHSRRCDADELCAVFPEVVAHAAAPLLRTAPAPLFLLAREVRRQGIKVVLTGEGADEMLGGYDLFKETRIREFWARQPESECRPRLLQRLYPWLPRLQRQGPAYLAATFGIGAAELADPLFSHLPRYRSTEGTQLFFRDELREVWREQPNAVFDELCGQLPAGFGQWPRFHQAQWLEACSFLPGYLLSAQGDRMAMAGSIEGRYPFLDHRVAELAARMPPRIKMWGLDEKRVLKDAMRNEIPPEITNRKKQPYRAPVAASFFDEKTGKARADWVEELTQPDKLRQAGVFDPARTQRLIAKARKGKAESARDGMALVGILSTQILAERFGARMENQS